MFYMRNCRVKEGITLNLPSLELYHELITRIDTHEKRLLQRYGDYIACAPGCDSCCILGSVCAVEAWVLACAYESIPYEQQSAIKKSVEQDTGEDCVFLLDGICAVYGSRPVICRTHGYPILVDGSVDMCPENFRGIDKIDSEFILDLEQLNTALGVINMRFLEEVRDERFRRDRVSLRELVSLCSLVRQY